MPKLCQACDQSLLGLGWGGRGENPAGRAVGGGGNLCSCQNCVKHVTNHFLDLDGVEEVKIQLEEQLAEVETSVAYDLEQYQEVLDDTIYEVEELV